MITITDDNLGETQQLILGVNIINIDTGPSGDGGQETELLLPTQAQICDECCVFLNRASTRENKDIAFLFNNNKKHIFINSGEPILYNDFVPDTICLRWTGASPAVLVWWRLLIM